MLINFGTPSAPPSTSSHLLPAVLPLLPSRLICASLHDLLPARLPEQPADREPGGQLPHLSARDAHECPVRVQAGLQRHPGKQQANQVSLHLIALMYNLPMMACYLQLSKLFILGVKQFLQITFPVCPFCHYS